MTPLATPTCTQADKYLLHLELVTVGTVTVATVDMAPLSVKTANIELWCLRLVLGNRALSIGFFTSELGIPSVTA